MNVVLWILQGALAAVMLMAGAMKAMQGKDKLIADPKMAWVEDFSDSAVRGIGGLEVLAAIGLVLPWALDIAPVLTPLAAVGAAAVLVGATYTHRRRGEHQTIPMTAVLTVIAVIVAVGRFADL